jgi:uncharacterized membrane protein
MNKYFKESIHWIFIALPFIYLATIYNSLPQEVPIHFNWRGEADDWADKTMLFLLPAGLGLFIYFLMLIVPSIDPKRKIQEMGSKYFSFRLILTIFFSILSIYLIYVTKEGSLQNPNILVSLIGLLFIMMGNYFQTVRPNYFIGIRTPWTLENEQVWKKTHRLAGKIWVAGGVVIMILGFLLSNVTAMLIAFFSIVFIIVLIPVVYSYLEFQKKEV